MIVLPDGLPLELTPFTFLLGKWEGTGVISYKPDDLEGPAKEFEFKQRIEFAHDGYVVTYISSAELIGENTPAIPMFSHWYREYNAPSCLSLFWQKNQ